MKRPIALFLACCLCSLALTGCLPPRLEPAEQETEEVLSALPDIRPTYLILQKGADTVTLRTHDPELIQRLTEAFCGRELLPAEDGLVLDRLTEYRVILFTQDDMVLLDIDAAGCCRVNKSSVVYRLAETETLYLAVQTLFLSLSKQSPSKTAPAPESRPS